MGDGRTINIGGHDTADYYQLASAGQIPGVGIINKFGTNLGITTTEADIWAAGGLLTYLTVAATLEAISSDTNDTAAGTNAREITIEGLDSLFNEITETVATAGTSASTATTASFIRVNKAYVSEVGAYGGDNAGNITIRVSGAGATQAYILADRGQTQGTHYTVPRGHTASIISMHASVSTTKSVSYHIHQRQRADDIVAPFASWRILFEGSGLEGSSPIPIKAPVLLPEKTDIRVSGLTSSGTAAGSFEYQILLSFLGVGE